MKKILIILIGFLFSYLPLQSSQNNQTVNKMESCESAIFVEPSPQTPGSPYIYEDQNYGHPGLLAPVLAETETIYYLEPPKIQNNNYFTYKGPKGITVDKEIVHMFDSILSKNAIDKYLVQYLSFYSNYTGSISHLIISEYNIFQKEKRQEAIAYLVWPFLALISFILIIIYYEEEATRHPLLLFFIVSLVYTITTFPDILILINGGAYSVVNGLGN